MDENLMDMKQMTDLFRVSKQTIRRWIKSGMPCLRPSGGVSRFRLNDVMDWVENQKGKGNK
jgi:excisionase family DNA binding protein